MRTEAQQVEGRRLPYADASQIENGLVGALRGLFALAEAYAENPGQRTLWNAAAAALGDRGPLAVGATLLHAVIRDPGDISPGAYHVRPTGHGMGPGQYWIESFEADIHVLKSGQIDVTERLTFHFEGSFNGIYRDISIKYETPSGLDYGLRWEPLALTASNGATPPRGRCQRR